MDSASSLKSSLEKIFESAKKNPKMSEENLKRYFYKEEILEKLGYEDEDIRVEKGPEGKRTDIHCLDDYKNVSLVIEFKKPSIINLNQHFDQLWDRYVKPLKADYGALTNGLQLLVFKRIDSNYERVLKIDLVEVPAEDCKSILRHLGKPVYELTEVNQVLEYFKKFDQPDERISLKAEESRKHFFENFKLERGSAFVQLVLRTMDLFEYQYGKSKFLTSAYDFWERSYAREPEDVPKNWKNVMEDANIKTTKENLFKFMFCLESTYALFTRLVLAKACEDYKFPGIDFSKFIKREVQQNAYRGEISQAAWAVLVHRLVEKMRRDLVESIFEEDIFYWWVDYFRGLKGRELFSRKKLSREMILFGESLAELMMTLYKFDFSEIVGDPLGTLYQKYFDKKTRKALGEFYTPKEVVSYIVEAVEYEGRKILDKRLLDPACGSGTFLVEALKRYLKASGSVAKKKGWDYVLDKLCNEFHIVGFDIHPFATLMAQIQFMLVLIPHYKKAIEQDRSFVLRRIPIFRTDSLIDESKSERMTLKAFEGSGKSVVMSLKLPIREEEGGFVEREFAMPYIKSVFEQTDLLNNEEYFSALQALFDIVKENARDENYEMERKELAKRFKLYLEDKNWGKLSTFFNPYGTRLLNEIKTLKHEFGDGRLVKSIEDLFLAALLKNEQEYDYVVGNPPYVRKELIDPEYKQILSKTYPQIYNGDNDLSVYFISRGTDWLNEEGRLGYITSNKFSRARYGKNLRRKLSSLGINKIIDFGDSGVFQDATNYPMIFALQKSHSGNVKVANVRKGATSDVLNTIKENEEFSSAELSVFQKSEIGTSWNLVPEKIKSVLDTLDEFEILENHSSIYSGIKTGQNSVYVIARDFLQKRKIPKKFYRPILKGKDIERFWTPKKDQFIIFPYDNKEYTPADLEQHPNLRAYLEEHRESLANRYDIKNSSNLKWYELRECDYYDIFEDRKIILPDIAQYNRFCIDEGRFCLNTAMVIKPEKERFTLEELVGILNSKVVEFFMKNRSTFVRNKYFRYIPQYLKDIPLPNRSDATIGKKVEKIIEIKKEKYRPLKSYIRGEKILHSLNLQSSHSSISPQVQKRHDGSYNVVIGKRKKEEPIIVDTKEKAKFVKLALEGKSFKKGEKIEILVPKSNKIVKEILEEYEKDKKELEEMPTVEELEEEINQIVYDLYDLDEEDIKVIENFLEKF